MWCKNCGTVCVSVLLFYFVSIISYVLYNHLHHMSLVPKGQVFKISKQSKSNYNLSNCSTDTGEQVITPHRLSSGISLHFLYPQFYMRLTTQCHAPVALPPRKRRVAHYTEDLVSPFLFQNLLIAVNDMTSKTFRDK